MYTLTQDTSMGQMREHVAVKLEPKGYCVQEEPCSIYTIKVWEKL